MFDFVESRAIKVSNSPLPKVDPQTGQLIFSIPIINIISNEHLGPDFNFTLHYRPNYISEQYGRGFYANVSQFDSKNMSLITRSGKIYYLKRNVYPYEFVDDRPLDFKFYKKGDFHYITHKNGIVERLSGDGSIKRLDNLYSPLGEVLYFTWIKRDGVDCLTEIRDPSTTYLQIVNFEKEITFISYPAINNSPTITLEIANKKIVKIIKGKEKNTVWSLDYHDESANRQGNFIKQISSPFQVKDYFHFNTVGFYVPERKDLKVPYIKQHDHTQYINEEMFTYTKRYEFTDTNYLGWRGKRTRDLEENEDYLYEVSEIANNNHDQPYSYQSIESYTIDVPKSSPTTQKEYKISRMYNKFHLKTDEYTEISHKDDKNRILKRAVKSVSLHYPALDYKGFAEQPVNYSKVEKITTEFKLGDSAYKNRKTEEFSYDDYGNITSSKNSDGREEKIEYYPAKGDVNCPPDINNFVRFIKMISRNTRSVIYTYGKIDAYEQDFRDQAYAVVCLSEKYFSAGAVCGLISHEYNKDKNEHSFGRKIKECISYSTHDQNTLRTMELKWTQGASYNRYTIICEKKFSPEPDGTKAVFQQTAWSLPLYQKIYEIDIFGNKTTYSYNDQNMLSIITHCQGQKNEKKLIFNYTFTDNQMITSYTDNEHLFSVESRMDVDGHVCKTLLSGIKPDSQKQILSMVLRDITGKIKRKITNDFTNQGKFINSLKEEYFYNIWDNLERVEKGDGTVGHYNNQPISDIFSSFWSGADANNKKTTTAALFKIMTKGKLSAFGRWNGEDHQLQYDLTQMEYDNFGRTTNIKKPDIPFTLNLIYNQEGLISTQESIKNSTLNYNYKSGVREPSDISVRDGNVSTSILSATYDSWGRILKNGLISYTYDSQSVTSKKMNDKEIINFTYYPEFLNKIKSLSFDTTVRNYTYDANNGLVTRISENTSQGEKYYEYQYDPFGHVIIEKNNYHNSILTSENDSTINGKPLLTKTTGARNSTFKYNEDGFITGTAGVKSTTDITYNSLSLVEEKNSFTKDSLNKILMRHRYDEFGRCTNYLIMTETPRFKKTCEVHYSFNTLDKLTQRDFLIEGNLIKKETFLYNSNNKLISYQCDGFPPENSDSRKIKKQTVVWDGFDRIISLSEESEDNIIKKSLFIYGDTLSPFKLTRLTQVDNNKPLADRYITYDDAGRITNDGFGQTYTYDTVGRLSGCRNEQGVHSEYTYDCRDRIISVKTGNKVREYYYVGDTLLKIRTEGKTTVFLDNLFGSCVTDNITNEEVYNLVATDVRGESLIRINPAEDTSLNFSDYLPWKDYCTTGANSNRNDKGSFDITSGCYIMGHGTRFYHPRLKQFLTPDLLSPVAGKYINPYSYCDGDPVNYSDPTGAMSLHAWGNILIGTGLIASSLATDGMASVASFLVRNLTYFSGATAVASGVLEHSDPKLSAKMEMASLGFGIAAIGLEIAKFSYNLINESQPSSWAFYTFPDQKDQNLPAFMTNYMGRGIAMYSTHGLRDSPMLMNRAGDMVDAFSVSKNDIIPMFNTATRDGELNLARDTPLLLVSCYAGRTSAALEVAQFIRRPVASYLNEVWAYTDAADEAFIANPSAKAYPAYGSKNKFHKLSSWLKGEPNWTIAPYHIYYPDDFFDGTHDIEAVLQFNKNFHS